MPEVTRRLRRLADWLADQPVDGLLVVHAPNVSYLTGFSGDSTYLLFAAHGAVLISDGRYETQIREECPGFECVIRRTTGEPMAEAVARAAKQLGVRTVAFESQRLSVAEHEALAAAADLVWVPVQGVVEQLRMVKDEEEVERIRRAVRVAEEALREAVAAVDWKAGISEAAFAGRLNAALRARGAVNESFEIIAASGDHAAQPHAHLDPERPLRLEEGVLVDWGARVAGYVSDLTRMLALSRMCHRFQAVVEAVVQAKEAAIAACRPGASAGEVHRAAADVLDRLGFGPFFRHSVGHGIGLEVHEEPFLRPNATTVLQPGMVVTIEPGVYLPGELGVRVEEDVLIRDDGPERLSSLPPVLTLD